MKLIKLDAIDSTNDFLKGLSVDEKIENFTVVTAESQTKGKGQRGSSWISENGKNLIVSVLIKDLLADYSNVFDLNIVVTLSVVEALNKFKIKDLSVKWPNDIMSGKFKIGGILIENSLKSNGKIVSIVGLGLNVNQTNFEGLPNASSLALVANTEFDKELILVEIIERLKANTQNWNSDKVEHLWQKYKNMLFKMGIPMPFENQSGERFMGIITDVDKNGKLNLMLEDDSVKEFDIKEIRMLY